MAQILESKKNSQNLLYFSQLKVSVSRLETWCITLSEEKLLYLENVGDTKFYKRVRKDENLAPKAIEKNSWPWAILESSLNIDI